MTDIWDRAETITTLLIFPSIIITLNSEYKNVIYYIIFVFFLLLYNCYQTTRTAEKCNLRLIIIDINIIVTVIIINIF